MSNDPNVRVEIPPNGREAVGTAAAVPRRVRSEDLLAGRTELVIEHQGRDYRLRITQNGKLILTA
jgi:hemin uptake protein HemP